MLSVALLCHALLCTTPQSQPATGGPQVTALEIFDVRHSRLSSKPKSGLRFSSEQPGLKLVVEVQGADVARASHFGMLEVAAAADDKDHPLKLNEDALGFHDPRKEMVEIDREQMFFGEEDAPKDAIRIEIPFESPARPATAISVRGKLQLKRIDTVDVVVAATPGDVTHEQLEKLGVKLKIIKPEEGNDFIYEVTGKLDALHDAELVDAQGKAIESNGRSSMSDGETLRREISLEKPTPADAKLKLSLVVKAENLAVPFDLKDLKLP